MTKPYIKLTVSVLATFALVLSYLIFQALQLNPTSPDVLGDTDIVTVTASVNSCILNFTTYPEKRIPQTGNWSTQINLQIRSSVNIPLGNVTFTTNNLGNALVNLCENGIFLTPGNYNFSVGGLSHLRRNFNNINGFSLYQTDFIRIGASDRLLAGETSVVFDNYINSLDLSFLVGKLYVNNEKADLNQDNVVNSLDLSNQVFNLYKFGDN